MDAGSVIAPDVAPVTPSSRARTLRSAVSLLSAAAAAIHFAVTGEHLREYLLFGAFFAATGTVQALWAILIMIRPSRRLYLAGAIGNLAIVAIWGLSRTAGLPVGPEASVPEPATVLDVVATSCEVLIGVGALALLRQEAVRRQVPHVAGMVLVLAVMSVSLGAVSFVAEGSEVGGDAVAVTVQNPSTITAENVGTLERAWTARVDALWSAPAPAGAETVAAAGGGIDDGWVAIYHQSCEIPCMPLWSAEVAPTPSQPVVDGDVVYVASGAYVNFPYLAAFRADCRADGGVCLPLWTGLGSGPLIVQDGLVIAGSVIDWDGAGPMVRVYEVGCATGGDPCGPLWVTDRLTSDVTFLAYEAGEVFVGSSAPDGYLIQVYDARCSTGGAMCEPSWTVGSRSYTPRALVQDGTLFVAGGGRVRAFPTRCASGGSKCSPAWRFPFRTRFPGLDVADGSVYVTGNRTLVALDADCGTGGTTCEPRWTAELRLDGVLAAGSGMVLQLTDRIKAFESDCGTGGATCRPAWSSPQLDPAPFGFAPILVNDLVFVASGRSVYAFRTSCQPREGACDPLWTTRVSADVRAEPSIIGSTLYIPSHDDRLFAFAPAATL